MDITEFEKNLRDNYTEATVTVRDKLMMINGELVDWAALEWWLNKVSNAWEKRKRSLNKKSRDLIEEGGY